MRILRSFVVAALVAVPALTWTSTAEARMPRPLPAATEMGTWDCNGSQPTAVRVGQGDTVYLWRGECAAAEGFSVVIEPQPAQLRAQMTYDGKTKTLTLRVRNSGDAVPVKMHVFVGFA